MSEILYMSCVFTEGGELFGYFNLTLRPLVIKGETISNTRRKLLWIRFVIVPAVIGLEMMQNEFERIFES